MYNAKRKSSIQIKKTMILKRKLSFQNNKDINDNITIIQCADDCTHLLQNTDTLTNILKTISAF